MKRSELKKALKPLIKECIREVIFEEGVLSGLISEVVKGTGASQVQPLQPKNENLIIEQQEARKEYKEKIRETKKKMLDAIGGDGFNGVNLFEGTDPLNTAGSVGGTPSTSSPLSNYAPEDSGIDISSLFSSKWKNLV